MKVVLISSKYDSYGEGQLTDNLGLLYLTSFLEQNNISVELIDALYEKLSNEALKNRIIEAKPDLVGVSCYCGSRISDFKTIKLVKQINKNIITVLGGPQASSAAKDILTHIKELDLIVVGEGEHTLLELCKAIENKNNIFGIKGIAYLKDNKFIQTPFQPYIEDLDSLPFPARHKHPMYKKLDTKKLYYINKSVGIYNEVSSSTHVLTGRGCPFNCIFCSTSPFWGKKVRRRSIKNIIDEIIEIKNKYGIDIVNFADDTINLNKDFLLELCNSIIEHKLNIKWQCNFRALLNMTRDVLKIMSEAGCNGIRMGVESASPEVLKTIKKGINLKDVENIISWCDEFGISRRLNYIINLPDETYEDAKKTVELAKRLGEPFLLNTLVIYPGSPVEQIAREKGILQNDFSWTDPNPKLKHSLPGRITNIPLFIDKIPLHKSADLLFQIESGRKNSVSLFSRLLQVLKQMNSTRDFIKLFSKSNFIFLFTYFKFKLKKSS